MRALSVVRDPVGATLFIAVLGAVGLLATTFVRTPVRMLPLAVSGLAGSDIPSRPFALSDGAPLPVSRDRARAINAAVPFVPGANVGAPPFRLTGSAADQAAAIACLTTAVLYEAGDDMGGQAAVAQVVLNRVRHPAFPKTVCGVVFQGAARTTGCQFTFACDGALARQQPAAAWMRARATAVAALAGGVDARVGYATHYHTDWVVPSWSAQLDKIARVGTHLFFRWKGGAGAAATFDRVRYGAEIVDPRIAAQFGMVPVSQPAVLTVSDAVFRDEMPLSLPFLPAKSEPDAAVRMPFGATRLQRSDPSAGIFVLTLAPGSFSGDHAMAALDLCRGRTSCAVYGYLRPAALPDTTPVSLAAAGQPSFVYTAQSRRAYWNCREIARPRVADCLPGTFSGNLPQETAPSIASAR